MKSLECLTKESIKLLQKNRLLQPLIKAEMVEKEISNILLETDIKQNLINNFIEKLGINDPKKYENWLTKNNITENEFEDFAVKNTKIKRYSQENYSHQVESHFLNRKSDLDIVVYSLIRVDNLFTCQELYLRLCEREADFGDIAAKYSLGIEKQTRGIIGPVPIGQTHPTLAAILQKSQPGEIQPPVQIESSFLIVKVESYDASRLDDFMKEKMAEELFNRDMENRANELCTEMVSSIKVENSLSNKL